MNHGMIIIERTIFHNWVTKEKCLGYRYWCAEKAEFEDTWREITTDDANLLAKICMENDQLHEHILASVKMGRRFRIDNIEYSSEEIEKMLANCALLTE